MKRILICLTMFWLVVTIMYGQKDYRALLYIQGRCDGFNISKDSTIWIATAVGAKYHTASIYQPWHEDKPDSDADEIFGMNFERATFFNKDTGYASGYLNGKNNRGFICWTNNGGRTWEKRFYGPEGWMDAHCYDYNGNAWMSGSSQYIFYTGDYGQTWETKAKIEPTTNMRISCIDFEGTRLGVVGDFWNRMYLTRDNCESWKKLETPLDQQKYKRLYSGERPTIYKAAIGNGRLIVDQEHRIFITALDSINWVPIEDAVDFAYDKETGKLFILDKELKVGITDERLNTKYRSDKSLCSRSECFKAFKGSVYSWHGDRFYKVNESEFYSTPVFTTDFPIPPPEKKIKALEKTWGVSDREVLQSDDYGARWYRSALLDFTIGNIKVIDDTSAIISDESLANAFLFNANTGSLGSYRCVTPLARFLKHPIRNIEFEIGSSGCFHYAASKMTYKLRKDTVFTVASYTKQDGNKSVLKHFKNSIPRSAVLNLLHAIDHQPQGALTFTDFQFAPADYEGYAALINKMKDDFAKGHKSDYEYGLSSFHLPYTDIDFSYLLTACDSIPGLDTAALDAVFRSKSRGGSTTTNWRKLDFINENNDKLEISNSDFDPNAFDLPWTITVDGLSFTSTDINVTRFFDANAPEEFKTGKEHGSIQAIFQMVNYLYRQRLHK